MKAVQERTDLNLSEIKTEIRANSEKCEVLQGSLASRMDMQQARTEVMRERLEAKIEANHEDMADLKTQTGCLDSSIDIYQEKADAWLAEMKTWRKETMACQEATEACLEKTEASLERKERTPVETARVAAYPEVPNQGAEAETVGALEDRYGEWHLAVGRRQQPKKRTQDDGGSRQKLAAVRRRITRRAVPARRKGRNHKGPKIQKIRRKKRIKDYVVHVRRAPVTTAWRVLMLRMEETASRCGR
jgi:chromosome segregation ATPase